MSLIIENSDGAIGAAVSGVDLTGEISDADFATVQQTIDARAVVVLRDLVGLPSSHLARFARRFGTPQINVRAEANNDENPDVFWVSNVHENGKPLGSHDAGRYWHSDLCYLAKPSGVTLLHALEVTSRGGNTCFTNVAMAFAAMPNSLKQRVIGRRVVFPYGGHTRNKSAATAASTLDGKAQELASAIHPAINVHPHTGEPAIYANPLLASRISQGAWRRLSCLVMWWTSPMR